MCLPSFRLGKGGSDMKEEKIFIKNNEQTIEGMFGKSSDNNAVIISHPHPLMGGSMYNNVVEAVQQAFAEERYSTLRFNFRGVGGSTGNYAEGIGEQDDILAVRTYLRNMGIKKILFAGYSFGAWVGAKIIEGDFNPFDISMLISPPNRYFDFNFDKLCHKINYIFCGDEDQFCDLGVIKKRMKHLGANIRIIPSADHFYAGKENGLIKIIRESLKNC